MSIVEPGYTHRREGELADPAALKRGTPTRCPICGEEFHGRIVRSVGCHEVFNCFLCDVAFAWPMEHPGASFYESGLDNAAREALATVRPASGMIRGPHRLFLRDLPNRGGHLLDVGCNDGGFLSMASRFYLEVGGIDVNQRAVRVARTRYRLTEVRAMTLAEFFGYWRGTSGKQYNVITLFDVFEHLDSPLDALGMLHEMMTDGSLLVLSMPNRDRSPNLAEEWDNPPNHLTYWNRSALCNTLEGHGFRMEVVRDFTEPGYIVIMAMDRVLSGLKRHIIQFSSLDAQRPSFVPTWKQRLLSYVSQTRLIGATWIQKPFDLVSRVRPGKGQMIYAMARKV